ncbi:MAG: molybdate ABC transporter substrate-binding protein [Desulfarculaceae bacterium]|nr:molybdate ABC transporter substrate-binding protein [Desulfarculaceae bacterium]MCF8072379.1 molybdate ABC transporter substrate-binding protein [Desulfarculaceae bacterium]MCF8100300.1 molybdate ABC transporter substrate-binding protein [Desulfarculaceae bacterium]MCF8116127.1 molybdate ABC transporter substrate-binding protein [Desulfarculaceae bacterium]
MRHRIAALIVIALLLTWAAPAPAAPSDLLVFAAASTTNAVTRINQAFTKATGIKATASFASSGTLAKQIASGAPADLFLSANVKWMDYLDKNGELAPGTRQDLLRNRLVLIAPIKSRLKTVNIAPDVDPLPLLQDGWMALGDPRHVPAGTYGQEALSKLGWWPKLKGHLALTANVRAALMLVERGEAALGVVYTTDALISKQVRIVGKFPGDTHAPIIYPAALLKGHDRPESRRYLEFLASPEAKDIFAKFGFEAYKR